MQPISWTFDLTQYFIYFIYIIKVYKIISILFHRCGSCGILYAGVDIKGKAQPACSVEFQSNIASLACDGSSKL